MNHKYPFTKQEGLKDCGPASLQMIIKYYKGYVSLDDLSVMMKTTKQGTTAYDLKEASEKLGFKVEPVKAKLEDITSDNIILPCIAHVIINKTYKHFIVIYKINFKNKTLIIADPQSKIKKISFKEFKKIYNNILIMLYPIKPIVRNNEVKLKDLLFSFLTNYKTEIRHLSIISFIYTILSLIASFYLKIIFDNINSSYNLISIVFYFFLILNIIKITSNYLRNKLLLFINKKFSLELQMDAYRKVLHLPYHYYKNRTTGEILSKIVDLDKLRDAINKVILTLFMDIPLSLIAIIILFSINKILFLISLLFLILYFIVIHFTKNILKDKIEEYYKSKQEMISYMQETISGFETVKGINLENIVENNYEKKYINYLNKIVKLDEFMNLQHYIKEFINISCDLIIIYIGVKFYQSNTITLGTLLAFNSIQYFFFSPIKNILDLDSSLIEAKKVLKKVYEMFKEEEVRKFNKNFKTIKINNLSYSYNDKKVLNNLNLEITSGEKILLVGDSGSGKSTLFKILMGYLSVDRNKIYFDNTDINDISNIRENISLISQNEILFTDTLYNNIFIYNDDTSVIKDCYIDEILKRDNLGYNMLIEENGFNLSGGQKQRIVLARTILKDFNILLIDEGLNQMDINLERKILINLFKRFKDKTIIVISHRMDNMDLYDKKIKLEEGTIYA